MPLSNEEIGRRIITFDPAQPKPEYFATATEMAAALSQSGRTEPVPWPSGLAPVAVAPPAPPDPSAPLPAADIIVVTWTAAEARALSILFTAGVDLENWFEYKHNLSSFIPKVTGVRAPFNDPHLARYYRSLGIYYQCALAGKKVLCFKSGLHMDYDGPALPIVDLWNQILDETGAKLVITTGTGGGIGADVLLGDVIIAADTVFDCTAQFAGRPFKSSHYDTSPLPANPVAKVVDAMLQPNADRVKASKAQLHPNGMPAFFYRGSQIASPKIVTTDTFAFDNSTDSAGLQKLGNVCDMGDASLGLTLSTRPNPPKWVAIRNASDPQIDGTLPVPDQKQKANMYYTQYGPFTTAASLIATWGVICELFPPAEPAAAPALVGPELSMTHLFARAQQRQRLLDPAKVLLQIAASQNFTAAAVPATEVSEATVSEIQRYLPTINVDPATSQIDYRRIQYTDESDRGQELFLVQVSNDDAESFRGSYLYALADLLAKEEFVSS